jgi:hypothetical protein
MAEEREAKNQRTKHLTPGSYPKLIIRVEIKQDQRHIDACFLLCLMDDSDIASKIVWRAALPV